jgi:translation initiation factor IF-3
MKKNKNFKQRENNKFKINSNIKARKVRLVTENGADIISIEEALQEAKNENLDLVEINANSNPPVCKLLDFKKFIYERKKKKQENKPKKVKNKEIRFTPTTDDHDYEFKLRHAKSFLEKGNMLKAFVFFKQRRMLNHKEFGEKLLLKLATDLEGIGVPDGMPKLEGKRMIINFKPKK